MRVEAGACSQGLPTSRLARGGPKGAQVRMSMGPRLDGGLGIPHRTCPSWNPSGRLRSQGGQVKCWWPPQRPRCISALTLGQRSTTGPDLWAASTRWGCPPASAGCLDTEPRDAPMLSDGGKEGRRGRDSACGRAGPGRQPRLWPVLRGASFQPPVCFLGSQGVGGPEHSQSRQVHSLCVLSQDSTCPRDHQRPNSSLPLTSGPPTAGLVQTQAVLGGCVNRAARSTDGNTGHLLSLKFQIKNRGLFSICLQQCPKYDMAHTHTKNRHGLPAIRIQLGILHLPGDPKPQSGATTMQATPSAPLGRPVSAAHRPAWPSPATTAVYTAVMKTPSATFQGL